MDNFFKGVDVDAIVPLIPQQVFDNALNGVVKQGRFSRSRILCHYTHLEDPSVHCGIGHSIPPEWDVENVPVISLAAIDPRVGALFKDIPRQLLQSIQSTHDSGARAGSTMSDFKEEMKKLAEEYNLTYTEPAT